MKASDKNGLVDRLVLKRCWLSRSFNGMSKQLHVKMSLTVLVVISIMSFGVNVDFVSKKDITTNKEQLKIK